MRYATVCSGIEACSSAWKDLGWEAEFFSEIDPFPSEVLKHHYPTVPNYGDMNNYKEWKDGSVDLICGGTPCQSFSVAGLRKGIESPNGQLMLTFGAILKKYNPRWMVWENVPGVLSSNRGKDFGTFLGMLGELGYGFAYRVLDAQYFGVAQRRRRVFVVGYLGDWKRAASVLFEQESLQGDLAKSKKKREGTARDTQESVRDSGIPHKSPTLTSNAAGMSRAGNGTNEGSWYIPTTVPRVSACITAELKKQVTNQMITEAESFFFPQYLGNAEGGNHDKPNLTRMNGHHVNNQTNLVQENELYSIHRNAFNMSEKLSEQSNTDFIKQDNKSPTIIAKTPVHGVAYNGNTIAIQGDGSTSMHINGKGYDEETSFTLNATDKHSVAFSSTMSQVDVREEKCITMVARHPPAMAKGMQVRRLTPTECERLQGFEDGHTKIPYRNKGADECPDGPRYKALGNSMAVPVMKWLGKRIIRTEKIFNDMD